MWSEAQRIARDYCPHKCVALGGGGAAGMHGPCLCLHTPTVYTGVGAMPGASHLKIPTALKVNFTHSRASPTQNHPPVTSRGSCFKVSGTLPVAWPATPRPGCRRSQRITRSSSSTTRWRRTPAGRPSCGKRAGNTSRPSKPTSRRVGGPPSLRSESHGQPW